VPQAIHLSHAERTTSIIVKLVLFHSLFSIQGREIPVRLTALTFFYAWIEETDYSAIPRQHVNDRWRQNTLAT
jgi:hypothetical protein